MKIAKRLKDKYALALGLELKQKNDLGNPKYYITPEQLLAYEEMKGNKVVELPKKKKEKFEEKPFVLSAWSKDGYMMDIDTYCNCYKLPRADIKRYKLVSHTGTPFYNIEFKDNSVEDITDEDVETIKEFLKSDVDRIYEYKSKYNGGKDGVLKWSDLHFGALIDNILHVKDFNKNILEDGLNDSVEVVNDLKFSTTHVHINGDLIESFSGLNHVNSWQSMDKDMIGANVIKMCSKMLHNVLVNVDNLGTVKIIAGNHDRTSKNNDEDVKGGGAELIAYCLELMGYNVEFHPYVISHYVDGINHINLHGDKGISKKSTEKIILDYGIQGKYNLINEGHLHSVIEKLSVKQRESFEIVKDDSILHRRFYLPSFFTGNYYSATLGYTTNPGYFIIWNRGTEENVKPFFLNGSV